MPLPLESMMGLLDSGLDLGFGSDLGLGLDRMDIDPEVWVGSGTVLAAGTDGTGSTDVRELDRRPLPVQGYVAKAEEAYSDPSVRKTGWKESW